MTGTGTRTSIWLPGSQLDARRRGEWLLGAWLRERDDRGARFRRRQRDERGQTAWDIGLDPQAFTVRLAESLDVIKPEHAHGVVFGSREVRRHVLSALLANAGRRRAVRLAPRQVWTDAMRYHAADLAYQHALAADRLAGTNTAEHPQLAYPAPVIRPEFVAIPSSVIVWPWIWARSELAAPFERWDIEQHGQRVQQLGYLTIGDHTLSRTDLLVVRRRSHTRTWPNASEAALVVYVASDDGSVLFDWTVRRPAHLAAGTLEVWVVDVGRQRLLCHRHGEEPLTVNYVSPDQIMVWRDGNDSQVIVQLKEVFSSVSSRGLSEPAAEPHTDFARYNQTRGRRLELFDTLWMVGHSPQYFRDPIEDLTGRFKDELWQGVLFGAEYQRDELLSALLANAGLQETVRLAPLELWEQTLAA
jgi:hypothetical protein